MFPSRFNLLSSPFAHDPHVSHPQIPSPYISQYPAPFFLYVHHIFSSLYISLIDAMIFSLYNMAPAHNSQSISP